MVLICLSPGDRPCVPWPLASQYPVLKVRAAGRLRAARQGDILPYPGRRGGVFPRLHISYITMRGRVGGTRADRPSPSASGRPPSSIAREAAAMEQRRGPVGQRPPPPDPPAPSAGKDASPGDAPPAPPNGPQGVLKGTSARGAPDKGTRSRRSARSDRGISSHDLGNRPREASDAQPNPAPPRPPRPRRAPGEKKAGPR